MRTFYEEIDNTGIKLTYSYNTYPSHFHKNIEILYVLKGELHVYINGDNYIANEGQFVFVDTNDIHMITSSKEYLTFLISPEYLSAYNEHKKNKTILNKLINDVDNFYYDIILKIYQNKSENFLYVYGLINELLGKILSTNELVSKKTKHIEYLRDIFEYVNNNYTENISLDFLSKKFGFNKCYLSTAFKTYFHCGFNDYLTNLRLNSFIKLVSNEEKPITQALYDSGFTSSQTFYRVFKKTYGKSPMEYFKEK